jgi:hypothetical protein
MPPRRLLLLVILTAVWFAAPPVRADVAVTGARDDVRIEVDKAAVEDVMDALGANFGLRYRSTAPLARRISGTHRGALERIVARVLDGYDFVVKTGPEGIEVTVYGAVKPEDAQRQAKSVKAAAPATTTKTSGARARREERRKRHAE